MNALSGLAMATCGQLLTSGSERGCCRCVSGILRGILISGMKGDVTLLQYDERYGGMVRQSVF